MKRKDTQAEAMHASQSQKQNKKHEKQKSDHFVRKKRQALLYLHRLFRSNSSATQAILLASFS